MQPLHNGEADRIGERKVLIGVPVDDIPDPLLIACSHADYCRVAFLQAAQERLTHFDPKGGEDERVRFNDEHIRHQLPVALCSERTEDRNRLLVMLIIAVQERQTSRRIEKDTPLSM